MTKFRKKTVSASASPVFFREILSPSSPILSQNLKHDLARSCFILKNICDANGDDDEDIDDDDNDHQVVDKQQVGRENMWQGWPLGAGASKV